MPTYSVPIEISPRDQHCGSCGGWGETYMAPDTCRVFAQKLTFFAADPECAVKGYRRCQACLDWERAHLAKLALARVQVGQYLKPSAGI